MLRCPVDVSMLEQLMEWPDVMENVATDNKLLKAGMRGHGKCGGLSCSCRLSASSLPLEPRMSALPFGGVYGALVDRLTCGGLAEGPLDWLSICACVEDGGQD